MTYKFHNWSFLVLTFRSAVMISSIGMNARDEVAHPQFRRRISWKPATKADILSLLVSYAKFSVIGQNQTFKNLPRWQIHFELLEQQKHHQVEQGVPVEERPQLGHKIAREARDMLPLVHRLRLFHFHMAPSFVVTYTPQTHRSRSRRDR